MNEATKYNRAKTWTDRIVCIKYDVNKYVSVLMMYVSYYAMNFRNVCSICIYTGNFYANF